MIQSFKKTLTLLSIALAIFMTLFVVSESLQLVDYAARWHPWAGYTAGILIIITLGFIIGLPLYTFFTLPRMLTLPEEENDEAFDTYLQALRKRLSKNPALAGESCLASLQQPGSPDRQSIEAALDILDGKAKAIVREAAATVFISTAISQNGRLDAFMVLGAQSRMIWKLAHLYNQRPHWRELVSLYNNVIITSFLAAQIEELDINERIEPIVRSALGSGFVGAMPGMHVAATILTQAVMEGTANAFLTLRVGMVCRRYCRSLTRPERRSVCRTATVEAAGMLTVIAMDSTRVVASAITRAVKNTGVKVVTSVGQNVAGGAGFIWETGKKAGKSALNGAGTAGRKVTRTGRKITGVVRRKKKKENLDKDTDNTNENES